MLHFPSQTSSNYLSSSLLIVKCGTESACVRVSVCAFSSVPLFYLSAGAFYLLLLPPTIFEAGYTLHNVRDELCQTASRALPTIIFDTNLSACVYSCVLVPSLPCLLFCPLSLWVGAVLLPAAPADHLRGGVYAPQEGLLPQHPVDCHVCGAGHAGVDVHHRIPHLPCGKAGEKHINQDYYF